jgi:S-DNA-T family DNA segregation ATPase FtsK/SpoIIIE
MLPPPPHPIARIAAPARPAPVVKQPFPLVATLAPVVMSLVLWVVTQSIFSLVFAALGPVIAIATLADARLGGRRRLRAEAARFFVEVEQARREVAQQHDLERQALHVPTARDLVYGRENVHWGAASDPMVCLGRADRRSAVTIDGVADARGDDPVSAALRDLRGVAGVLSAAPFVVAAGRGIGIVGSPVLAAALARAVAVQLLASCSPATHAVTGASHWLEAVPHSLHHGPVFSLSTETTTVTVAIASEVAALPPAIDTVVRLESGDAVVVRGTEPGQRFAPDYLSSEEALLWAQTATAIATRTGVRAVGTRLSHSVSFAELEQQRGGALSSTIGIGEHGPVVIDLALDGPHAIVGGTTGSGKSELLVSWLLALAVNHPPDEVVFLLFDFKGGSSFGKLPSLPHCVGLVTDLDPGGAARAIASLAAELRHRERVIAAAGARTIEQVPALPRLVIVVDEFAAMAAELPELHAQFGDIAARGRSLGVHLVLCTQRPAGVVRDAVLANASLRISLRVNNRADSSALIGTDAAARSSSPLPGRAWLARGGDEPEPLQVAMATDDDIARVAERWGTGWSPRRPWVDPLPSTLHPLDAPGAIALVDLPAEQAQRPLEWNPGGGNLLVVGASASGKSTALRTIGAVHGGDVVAAGIEAAWDSLDDPPPLLLLDDVDALLGVLGADHQQAFIDRLGAVLRGGESTVVLSAQRLGAALQQLSALCDHRLLLRMPTRQEHVIAGGSGETFIADLPPGAGWWRGDRVHVVLAPPVTVVAPTTSVTWAPRGPALAVSPRPQALAARLAAAGFDDVQVTDPDSWLADWGRFSALSRSQPVLFHECTPTEFRQLSRRRALPPPIADAHSTGWLLEPECVPVRVRLESD